MKRSILSIFSRYRRLVLPLGGLISLSGIAVTASYSGAQGRREVVATPLPGGEYVRLTGDPEHVEVKLRSVISRGGDLRALRSSDEKAARSPEVANAIRNLPGCNSSVLPANDDDSAGPITLPFPINYFGTTYSQTFVNNNGNITFGGELSTFTPFNLNTTNIPIIAPFFADVDTNGTGSGLTSFGNVTVDGRRALCVNWVNVGYFFAAVDKLNSFQLILIERSDTGPGNFDIEFNYNSIQWETGSASGGTDGLGGNSARAGYANGTQAPGTSFEIPGSAVNGAFLDNNLATGLSNNSSGSSERGRYIFAARNGGVATPTPTPTPEVTVAVAPASVQENGAANLVYTFTRSGGTGAQMTANYTVGGTATAGSDFSIDGSGTVTFALGSSTTTVNVDPIPDLIVEPDETVVVTVTPGTGYNVGSPASATGTIVNVPAPFCSALPISFGQTYNGNLSSDSCVFNGNRADFYSFSGTAGQRVAVTMTTIDLFSRIELVGPTGTIIDSIGPGTMRDSRLPAADFLTLPAAGMYTIRAIGANGGTGAYSVSLFAAPTTPCTFSLSPTFTNVPSSGGTFFFDVLTQPGCAPPAAPVAPQGVLYSIVSYINGRVTFNVSPNEGVARQATILVGNMVHNINQAGTAPPDNDLLANAQVLAGLSTPLGIPILGFNANATAESGEPAHAGNTAAKSVWYSFTPSSGGLFSFSTTGSSFDTVMAIYACPSSGTCTFANFTPVGSNDDTTAFDVTSKINFRADAGTRYVIAVDGKNGANGTIQLAFGPYQRLFRVYLHNYNGNPITIVPDSVRASNGTTTIDAIRISLGVYEFNLPQDNSVYTVNISGPTGIVWNPNNYPLDTSFRILNELMEGAGSGGQNTTSNAQCLDGCDVIGFVRNITAEDVVQGRIKVRLGYSRAATPARRDEEDCRLSFQSDLGVPHARYQCTARPQANHDIVPAMAGRRFTEAIFSFGNPVGVILEDIRTPRFVAANAETFSISGRVLAGGAGTVVELAYTPPGGLPIRRDTRTGPNGVYEFADLAPGTYQPTARREGIVFNTPPPVTLATANAVGVDISAQATCSYGVTNPGEFASAGGAGGFAVSTASNCDWEARSDVPWIIVNSGVGRGNGTAQITVLPNMGPARTGTVRLTNRPEAIVITQAAGCGYTLSTPTQVNFTAAGGSGSVNVTTSAAECSFAPTATDFCMITGLTAAGTGPGTVNFTVSANAGVARSTVITIGGQTFTLNQAAAPGTHRSSFDFDGDGRADLAVYRPGSGFWFVQTLAGFSGQPFGVAEDIPVAADYDGDGRTDIAVFRPSSLFWYVNGSTSGFTETRFGQTGDTPVPADYDGDGRADIAHYRRSDGTWRILRSSDGVNFNIQHGASTDKPVPADYDGDGRADIAVYRPSTGFWHIIGSGGAGINIQFGAAADMPVPGDYDRDGRAELAVYRPSDGIWYRLNAQTGAFAATQWGAPGDLPVPADYNGDRSTDLAVYRPSNGIWFVWSCTNNPQFNARQFGASGDKIVPFRDLP